MTDRKKPGVAFWATVLAVVALFGIAIEFVPPSNLAMTLIDLFQWGLLIALFLWCMWSWRRPSTWVDIRKRRLELLRQDGADRRSAPPPADESLH